MSDANALDELQRAMRVIKDRIRAVAHRYSNGAYLFGRPGTSKTYTVRTTLEEAGVDYFYSTGHLTPIGLFDLISDYESSVIVIDDVASLFYQRLSLQFLLAALGNSHDGSGVRLVRRKTANETRTARFTGGIICISNLSLDGHHGQVLAALRDRISVTEFDPPNEQIEALILDLAERGIGGVAPDSAGDVARFMIAECQARGVRPSVRMFVDKALQDFKLFHARLSESHWKDLLVCDIEEHVKEPQHAPQTITLADQQDAERSNALDICQRFTDSEARVVQWKARTRKGPAAFYKRVAELQRENRLPMIGSGIA